MNEKPQLISKIEQFIDYICAPVVRFTQKHNKHQNEKVKLSDRSLFSTGMTIFSSASMLIALIQIISGSISSTWINEPQFHHIASIYALPYSYINFAFAYYFDITFTRYIKFCLMLILKSALISAAIVLIIIITYYLPIYIFNVDENIAKIITFVIATPTTLYGTFRIFKLALYDAVVKYSEECVRLYEEN